jgi:hypothetical protein
MVKDKFIHKRNLIAYNDYHEISFYSFYNGIY